MPPAGEDRKLALIALEKRRAGKRPSKPEAAALRRVERQQEETLRWTHYTSIPQKHWRAMSGRAAKVLAEQAGRYGIPFGGAVVDLPRVVRALHDFLAANARRLAATDDEGLGSPALERKREEDARIARLRRRTMEGQLADVALVREGLSRIALMLRRAAESIERRFGADAARILHDALDDADREAALLCSPPAAAQPEPDAAVPPADPDAR